MGEGAAWALAIAIIVVSWQYFNLETEKFNRVCPVQEISDDYKA